MKRISQCIIAFILSSLVFSQNTGKVKGTIKSVDGAGLAGANITLEGTGLGVASSENGDFLIVNVPVGVYSIKGEYIGFSSKIIEGVRVSADLTTVLNVELEVSTVEGQEVRVVAENL